MLRYTVTCVIHRCLLAAVLNYTPNIYILPLEGRIVLFCAGPSTLWALRAPVLHFSLLAHKLLHILIHYTCRHHPVIQRSHYISPPVYNTQDFPLCIMHYVWILYFSSLCSLKWKWNRSKQNSFTTFSFLSLNMYRWPCDSPLDSSWLTWVTCTY